MLSILEVILKNLEIPSCFCFTLEAFSEGNYVLIKKNIQKTVKSLLVNLCFRIVYGNTFTKDYVDQGFFIKILEEGGGVWVKECDLKIL